MLIVMNRVKISAAAVTFLVLSLTVFAAQMNSTNFKQNVVVSSGGSNLSSSSYEMGVAVGLINWVINSTSYFNKLGFFHLLLLADSQPCTTASECEGGFCCSSLCKSSACAVSSTSTATGGGAASASSGGGSLPAEQPKKISGFSISTNSISEKLALGDSITKPVIIKNTGDLPINFGLKVLTVDNFVSLPDGSFTLEPNQEKSVNVILTGRKVGSYIGEIQVIGNGIAKSVNVVANVESELVLFDVKLDIPSAYQEVEAGDELREQITLLNVGPPRKVDVTATYIIKDIHGNTIDESSETFAADKQTSYVKSFRLRQNMPAGDYLAVVELRYEKSVAVSSQLFSVAPKKESDIKKLAKSNNTLLYVSAASVAFILLFMYMLLPKDALLERIRRRK